MKCRILLAFLTMLLCYDSQAVTKLDTSQAWFKPQLVENKHPACTNFYRDAVNKFFSDKDISTLYLGQDAWIDGFTLHRLDGFPESIETWSIDKDTGQRGKHSRMIPKITAYGKTFYLDSYTHSGCGGACERYQLLVSEVPFPFSRRDDPEFFRALSENAPPAGYFTVARDADNHYYTLLVDNMALDIYQLQAEGNWAHSCKIRFAPAKLQKIDQPELQTALAAVEALEQATNNLRRGAGTCGSMKTHLRWASYMHDAFLQTLYRPWALYDRDDSYGMYNNDLANLENWALTGISESRALEKYKVQLELTTKTLAGFYEYQYDWPREHSYRLANKALTAAVSSGIRFYSYQPFQDTADQALRRAIFDRIPMEELHTLDIDPNRDDADTAFGSGYADDVLNVAVSYPEALTYLLEQGYDPNVTNAFGKTPLMYAAQYNHIEAARILLKYGADPNATTTRPQDNCYYTLTTANMTPLHYATRYASAEMIRLLLGAGAVTYIKTETWGWQQKDAYPIDWLQRYTVEGAEELNPHIRTDEIEMLERLLKVEDASILQQHASEAILRAEAAYQNGDHELSYRILRNTLNIEPDNERALSNLSLVALKNGKYGESLKAGTHLIKVTNDDRLKANVWFNLGLACEEIRENGNRIWHFHDGVLYCQPSIVHYYLRAWLSHNTESRASKLVSLFKEDKIHVCNLSSLKHVEYLMHFDYADLTNTYPRNYTQRIYILHDPLFEINVNKHHWEITFWNGGKRQPPKTFTPKLSGEYSLDKMTLTVLESENRVVFPYHAGDDVCEQ